MDHYITAKKATGILQESRLQTMIDNGTIRTVVLKDLGLAVSEKDLIENLPREERPQYKAVAHLRLLPIGVNEAARKYDIPKQTISRWVKKGFIAIIGSRIVRGGNQVLLDEADVAYVTAIYKLDPGQGKTFIP